MYIYIYVYIYIHIILYIYTYIYIILIPNPGFKGGTPVIHFNVAEEKSHLCLSRAMENSPLKEIIYPQRSPRLTHGGACFFPFSG